MFNAHKVGAELEAQHDEEGERRRLHDLDIVVQIQHRHRNAECHDRHVAKRDGEHGGRVKHLDLGKGAEAELGPQLQRERVAADVDDELIDRLRANDDRRNVVRLFSEGRRQKSGKNTNTKMETSRYHIAK
jgi:hypothetical protein